MTITALIRHCATLRPAPTQADSPTTATLLALRVVARPQPAALHRDRRARRHAHPPVAAINPALVAPYGVATDGAGQLLVTAGTSLNDCGPKPRSPCSPEPHPAGIVGA